VEFTNKAAEAKKYNNDWFAMAEKTQLQHYASLPVGNEGFVEDYTDTIPHIAVHLT
jgi:hypothetical protein